MGNRIVQGLDEIFSMSRNGSNEGKNETAVFMISGKEMHTLQDIKEAFELRELCEAAKSGILFQWLKERYYEREALLLEGYLEKGEGELERGICSLFDKNYSQYKFRTEEEQRVYEQRMECLREKISEEDLLSKAEQIAMNQEELAMLLNQGETQIYLLGNDFSLPIQKSGITYIGIQSPRIESCFSKEQYKRAGIIITDTVLVMKQQDEKMERLAETAAKNAGYDSFGETHNVFTTAVHEHLKINQCRSAFYTNFRLPLVTDSYHMYKSRLECQNQRDKVLKKAYQLSEEYFDINSSKSILKKAVPFYVERITDTFQPIMAELERYSRLAGKTTEFEQLQALVAGCSQTFTKEFSEEITDNEEYYKMYRFQYFQDQVEIETHDNSIDYDDFTLNLFDKLLNRPEYYCDGIFRVIQEMEEDVRDKADGFAGCAHSIYNAYVKRMEDVIAVITKQAKDEEFGNGSDLLEMIERAVDSLEKVMSA